MEGRGKSRRRNPYQTWKRRASAMLAVLLTLSLVLGDISGLSRTVMAGQRSVKEEFRIHREAILKAAEEAIEKGEPLSQPLAITSDEEKTETKYQELLAADGTVYEIFPEIEQVQDVDSLELRVFIRLEEGADPASYTLTGEEELIFLYVNGGGVTAEGQVNIDGYVSDFIEVEPLEEEDDAVWTAGSGNAGGGNTGSGNTGSGNTGSGNAGGSGSAVGAGSENGNGSVDESDNAAGTENDNGDDENAGNNDGSGTMSPEDSAADLTQSADEEEADDKTNDSESSQKPEDTLPAETEETEEAEETEADKKEDAGKPEKNPAESGADVSAVTGDKTEEKETAGNTDENGSADKDAADKDVTGETEKEEDTNNSEKEDGTEATGDESEDKDEDKNTSASDDDQDENTSDDDAADTNDAEGEDEKDDTGSTVTVSLRQIQRVAASLASDSDAEKETTGSAENGSNGSGSNGTGSTGTEGTGSGSSGVGSGSSGSPETGNKNTSSNSGDDKDSYYENTGDPFDEEDAAGLEDEDSAFKKVKTLEGTRYDEAVLDEVLAIRAFVVSMEDAGFDKEEILEGAHHLTYTVSEGEARVVYNPEYVRDEAVVTFGIIPAEGMEVYQVTANGEALAETEKTAAIASASEAKRASSSDADVDEERAVYYRIPEVLEDQDVQIQVVEEGYNSHPVFLQSRTVNGVTVTVSAEEGILPAGTELSVEEVTEQIANAVVEKVEAEAAESSDTIEAKSLDSDESEDGEQTLSVTEVIAYDINLMLDGKKLNNDYWGENNVVTVTFSGDRIEQASQEAEKIQIAALETPTETVEAALGGTEEMPIVENLTAEDIQIKTEGREFIDVSGENAVREIGTEVSHFTVYTITFSGFKGDLKYIHIEDEDGNPIGQNETLRDVAVGEKADSAPITTAISIIKKSEVLNNYYFHNAYVTVWEDGEEKKYTLESIYNQSGLCYRYQKPYGEKYEGVIGGKDNKGNEDIAQAIHFVFTTDNTVTFSANDGEFPSGEELHTAELVSNTTPIVKTSKWPEDEPELIGAKFSGWVYKDAEFTKNTYACAGTTIYALYNTDYSERKENKNAGNENAGKVTAKKNATWIDYDEGIARIDFSVSGVPKEGGIDVVIVLDKSGSMSSRLSNDDFPERMKGESGAREAAKTVINSLLTESGNNRVAYVPFSAYYKITSGTVSYDSDKKNHGYNVEEAPGYLPQNHTESYVGFQTYSTENTNHYLEYAINATDAYGGTDYTGALAVAREIIGVEQSGSEVTRPTYIIFISDGQPNAKYDSSHRATTMANDLRRKGVTIYSVGLDLADPGTLGQICGPAGEENDSTYYHDVTGVDNLLNTLKSIVDNLETAGKNGKFVDIISGYYEPLSEEQLIKYGYANSPEVSFDNADRKKVTITVGDIPVAEKTYSVHVKINKNLENTTGVYETNNDVNFHYTDENDEVQPTIPKEKIGDPNLDRYGAQLAFQKILDDGGTDYESVNFALYKAVYDESQGKWVYATDKSGTRLQPIEPSIGVTGDRHVLNIPLLGYGNYLLVETATAAGYQLLEEPILIQVDVTDKNKSGYGWFGTKDEITGIMKSGVDVTIDGNNVQIADGKYSWTITNEKLPELPETGGPGLIMMERFGWMLLLISMMGVELQLLAARRKRK